MDESPALRVCVVYSAGPRTTVEKNILLAAGSTVDDALQVSGILQSFPDLRLTKGSVGIWGRKVGPGHPLRDQDRVEIYRPLLVDPKVARRERFVKQGARKSGLFASRRPGAKAGY